MMVLAGTRRSLGFASFLVAALVAGLPSSAVAGQPVSTRVACTETALLAAIGQANANGGGTITFNCRAVTISMKLGFGTITDNVVIDGEDRNIVLQYTGSFVGCDVGDNGASGPAIGNVRGHDNVIRHLTFKNFLESLQIIGPDNVVESNVFLAHACSDDGLSTTTLQSLNATIRNNRFQGYRDKAYQMSYGSGIIEGNTFVDCAQPIRGPYDNSLGGLFVIRSNVMTTTVDREACTGVTIDGTYQLLFEGNTVRCYRGIRLTGHTQTTLRDNVIDGNTRAGVTIGGSALASFSGNIITGNGLTPGSEPAGGVVVMDGGQADLGGGTLTIGGQVVQSTGRNRMQGNGVADVRNLRTGYTVKAEADCWDHQTATLVTANDRIGDVDVDPISLVCTSTPPSPPSPPIGLRVITAG